MLDRVFDNHVMTPMQKLVWDSIRAEADRDSVGTGQARATLDAIYIWLDARLLARPSAARCVEEARPYRSYFPPGAPDRD